MRRQEDNIKMELAEIRSQLCFFVVVTSLQPLLWVAPPTDNIEKHLLHSERYLNPRPLVLARFGQRDFPYRQMELLGF